MGKNRISSPQGLQGRARLVLTGNRTWGHREVDKAGTESLMNGLGEPEALFLLSIREG